MEKLDVLKKYFNYDGFRTIQEECIDSILSGKDTLVVMATGGGKSVIFQVPGLMLEGLTLVISPLISLMYDQVKRLKELKIEAETINSNIAYEEELRIYELLKKNKLKFLYVSPERLENPSFIERIKNINISQIVIDESHCIDWGVDFRPSYFNIRKFIELLDIRPVISCFTATASKTVINTIKSSLNIEPTLFYSSFDRPNLYYETIHIKDKKTYIVDFLKKHQDSCGIIYTLTRKKAEEIFQLLIDMNYKVSLYHGGLDDDIKEKYQDEFLSGKTNILVGTSAFGMGIDKPNIRYVINYDLPESMEDLSQQQGRCSRDGNDGICILLYNEQDLYINEYFINQIENSDKHSKEEIKLIKKEKREKLKSVITYATTRRCLHEYMVSYFGELYMSYCNNCSNCLKNYTYIDAVKEAKVIYQFLSTYNNRFGINTISEVLSGIKSETIINNHLKYSPFFNIINRSKDEIKDIIFNMIKEDLIKVSDGKYKVIGLSKNSDILRDMDEFKIRVYKDNGVISKILGSRISLKDKLFSFRDEKAKREGIASYMVLTTSCIEDLVKLRPKSIERLKEIKGIGDKKIYKYGNEIINIINS